MHDDPWDQVPPGPPRSAATAGDVLFALGVAALGILLAGALLAAGGGGPWLAGLVTNPGGDRPAGEAGGPAATATGGSSPAPSPSPPASAAPGSGSPTPPAATAAVPAANPSPAPPGEPFMMNLYRDGVFVHQADKEWCVAAAAQNMLNVIRVGEDGRDPDVTAETQQAIDDRIVELTTSEDSHNGGTGPGGWAAYLTEAGYPYEVRVYPSRLAALRAAATALRETGRPVGILAWAGVHSWVLTGFTASADPATARMFAVSEAYVLDPWYPWISTRWPRSEPPNAPRDLRDLVANVLPWNLASGPYPGRDGRFLLVVPLEG